MKVIKINNLNDYYRRVGKFLGYPSCCIKDFIERHGLHPDFEPIRATAGKGTGFLPCLKHAKLIAKGEITLESLIKNRKAKEPFPHLPVDELGKYFILDIPKKDGVGGYVVVNNKSLNSI